MNIIYLKVELVFEKLTSIATRILGNAITFILAFILVIYWWATNLFTSNNQHQNIGDIIFGITFLSLFVIQKSFNRYSALIHLKINELISSHEPANNSVMNTSQKTEQEIRELAREYIDEEIEKIIKEDADESQI
ncbi:low affinity iron permease family protein [Flavobacterium paronense]|uniref:Low affinity iron permease family protein n=1 Tax=Flavobacterium paronense TaxID=1392775 RepID=A0ABV5GBP6_9FLAO|nr:low affinity iron permease family protein [Flavobacterium paronense]MDN3677630.1 low affinity iron permease family protein [Flavobacterium paronense]